MSGDLLQEVKRRLVGPVVPMTTPIREDGEVDYEGLSRLTRFYVDHGIKALIAVGTTGYCYALTENEHQQAVETVVQAAGGRALVIAGVSHSGTMMANRLADICEAAGADALLMTPPYYHQTDAPEGVYRHYRSVAENHSLGLIVYKTPAMTAGVEFFERLAEVERIVAIKDASGDYNFARDCSIRLGERFAIFSGGSMRYYLWHWLWGAKAYVTSIANLVPHLELEFFDHLQNGDLAAARRIVAELEQPFFEVMLEHGWHESLHAALRLCGLPAGGLRLPLVAPPEDHLAKMEKVFRELGLLQ